MNKKPEPVYAVFGPDGMCGHTHPTEQAAYAYAVNMGYIIRGLGGLRQGYYIKEVPTVDIDAIHRKNGAKPIAHVVLAMAAMWLSACTEMTPTMQLAEAVNHQVNNAISYQSDIEQYGQSDRWVTEPSSGKGDCEDYALTKASRLNAGGVVTSVEVCLKSEGPSHAVAVVHDNGTDWVLDNLYPYAIPLKDYDRCTAWVSAARLNKSVYTGK